MARSANVTVGGAGKGGGGAGKPRKRRRLRRFLLVSLVVVVVLVVGVIALVPTIAGSVAPGMIEGALNPKLNGRIDVSDVRVRWMRASRPVQTATAAIFDEDGDKIAQVQIEAQFGLLNAVGGIGDLGEFVITGHGDVVRHADGTTNIERVFEPLLGEPAAQPPPSAKPVQLPDRLRAVVRIASLTGTYTDESLPEPLRVRLESMTGRMVFATGQPAELELDAVMDTGAPGPRGTVIAAAGGAAQRGTLAIDAKVDGLTSAQGALTVATATANITAAARDLPLAVVDSLGGLGGMLTRAVGERLGFDVVINGTMDRGTGRVALTTDGGASVRGAVGLADRVLTTTEPLVLTFDTARAAAADPAIAAALAGNEAARITTLPTLTVTLADLRVAMPGGASAGTAASGRSAGAAGG